MQIQTGDLIPLDQIDIAGQTYKIASRRNLSRGRVRLLLSPIEGDDKSLVEIDFDRRRFIEVCPRDFDSLTSLSTEA